MKSVFISDVHIKKDGDEAFALFSRFVDAINKDDTIVNVYLLGDIIDLMVGPYEGYLEQYPMFFGLIKKMLINKKNIYFFEGNHDFHCREVIEKLADQNSVESGKLIHISDFIIKEKFGKSVYIGHGDEIEIENPTYQIYKYFIMSRFIKLFLENIVKFEFVDSLGKMLSKRSRARNKKRYSTTDASSELIRNRFRESAKRAMKTYQCDVLICGHSHVKDAYEASDRREYYNNGYFLKSRCYIEMSSSGMRFVDL
jgi:UDP-2,3-diacylglucosamine hydrolase